jgi:hypothetical protein
VRRAGEHLIDQLAPVPSPSHPAWSAAYARRRELRSFLELDVTMVGSVRAGAAVLAPLASGLIAVLLPKG